MRETILWSEGVQCCQDIQVDLRLFENIRFTYVDPDKLNPIEFNPKTQIKAGYSREYNSVFVQFELESVVLFIETYKDFASVYEITKGEVDLKFDNDYSVFYVEVCLQVDNWGERFIWEDRVDIGDITRLEPFIKRE